MRYIEKLSRDEFWKLEESLGIPMINMAFCKSPYSQWEKKKGIFPWFSLEFPRDSYGFLKEFPKYILPIACIP